MTGKVISRRASGFNTEIQGEICGGECVTVNVSVSVQPRSSYAVKVMSYV